jgi:hypothetical protein
MSQITIEWSSIDFPTGQSAALQKFGSLEIDGNIVERRETSANIPEYPVEDGIAISDHASPNLDIVSLDCIVTNHPYRSIGSKKGFWTVTSDKVSVYDFPIETDRPQEVWDQLHNLCRSGVPVSIIGSRFGGIEDFLIKSISFPIVNDNAVEFNMVVQELRKVTTETVSAPEPRVERGRVQRDNGRQTPEEDPTLRSHISALLVELGRITAGLGS